MKRVAVVVPLRPGGREAARLLIEQGPPFDLGDTGLERHEVYLTDREAVFVFEGPHPRQAVERLLGEADVWRMATAWRDCVGGRPRLAEDAYAWDRPTRPLHAPGF